MHQFEGFWDWLSKSDERYFDDDPPKAKLKPKQPVPAKQSVQHDKPEPKRIGGILVKKEWPPGAVWMEFKDRLAGDKTQAMDQYVVVIHPSLKGVTRDETTWRKMMFEANTKIDKATTVARDQGKSEAAVEGQSFASAKANVFGTVYVMYSYIYRETSGSKRLAHCYKVTCVPKDSDYTGIANALKRMPWSPNWHFGGFKLSGAPGADNTDPKLMIDLSQFGVSASSDE